MRSGAKPLPVHWAAILPAGTEKTYAHWRVEDKKEEASRRGAKGIEISP